MVADGSANGGGRERKWWRTGAQMECLSSWFVFSSSAGEQGEGADGGWWVSQNTHQTPTAPDRIVDVLWLGFIEGVA